MKGAFILITAYTMRFDERLQRHVNEICGVSTQDMVFVSDVIRDTTLLAIRKAAEAAGHAVEIVEYENVSVALHGGFVPMRAENGEIEQTLLKKNETVLPTKYAEMLQAQPRPQMTQEFAPVRRISPFKSYDGELLGEGDWIVHPSGEEARVVFDETQKDDHSKWRVDYCDGNPTMALFLQINDRGQAVKKK